LSAVLLSLGFYSYIEHGMAALDTLEITN